MSTVMIDETEFLDELEQLLLLPELKSVTNGEKPEAVSLQPEAKKAKKSEFPARISVRFGIQKIRLELAPAVDHGGPQGFYRIRAGRVWMNGSGGEKLFFDKPRLAQFLAELAFDGFEEADGLLAAVPGQPENMKKAAPDLPRGSRMQVTFEHTRKPQIESVHTLTPPIQAYDGFYYVGVVTAAAGFMWVRM